MLRTLATALALAAPPAAACDLALVLAVDVSGSVDRDEYAVQMQGLATALADGIVAEALVDQRALVTLVQWTGSSRQEQTLPWTSMHGFGDVAAFAHAVSRDTRVWSNYSTAIGEALAFSLDLLGPVSHCKRRVIDVSGDGINNEGAEPQGMRAALRQANVTVNALAIETDDADLTAYFFENLITGERAFVETATGFADYPAAILRKLQRETARISAELGGFDSPGPLREQVAHP